MEGTECKWRANCKAPSSIFSSKFPKSELKNCSLWEQLSSIPLKAILISAVDGGTKCEEREEDAVELASLILYSEEGDRYAKAVDGELHVCGLVREDDGRYDEKAHGTQDFEGVSLIAWNFFICLVKLDRWLIVLWQLTQKKKKQLYSKECDSLKVSYKIF